MLMKSCIEMNSLTVPPLERRSLSAIDPAMYWFKW
jgi:hypothetical protein